MLAAQEDVERMLIDPHDGSPLRIDADGAVGLSGRRYSRCGGRLVLMNFEKSVFESDQYREGGGEVVARRRESVLVRGYRWLTGPERRKTERNVARFCGLCREMAERPQVLVVGGGTVGAGSQALYMDERISVVSFDVYPSAEVHFVADAHNMPLQDESFDGVFVQAVLEHVLCPEKVIAECLRVLKPNGVFYAETPFMQQVHEGAYDFTRYTESGHRWLLRNFERLDSGALSGPSAQLVWSLAYVARGVFRSQVAAQIVRLLFCWLPLIDMIIPERYRIDGACGVYFLGRRATGIGVKDIVAHYLGARRRK